MGMTTDAVNPRKTSIGVHVLVLTTEQRSSARAYVSSGMSIHQGAINQSMRHFAVVGS